MTILDILKIPGVTLIFVPQCSRNEIMFFMLLSPKSGRLVTFTSFSVPLVSDIVYPALYVWVWVCFFSKFVISKYCWFCLLFLVFGCKFTPVQVMINRLQLFLNGVLWMLFVMMCCSPYWLLFRNLCMWCLLNIVGLWSFHFQPLLGGGESFYRWFVWKAGQGFRNKLPPAVCLTPDTN